jgi:hypothetical protein
VEMGQEGLTNATTLDTPMDIHMDVEGPEETQDNNASTPQSNNTMNDNTEGGSNTTDISRRVGRTSRQQMEQTMTELVTTRSGRISRKPA